MPHSMVTDILLQLLALPDDRRCWGARDGLGATLLRGSGRAGGVVVPA